MSVNMDISKKILGLPLSFNNVCDPHQRVFIKTFFSQANIVNFIPGRPQFNEGKFSQEKYDLMVKQGLIPQPINPEGDDLSAEPLSGLFGSPGSPSLENLENAKKRNNPVRTNADNNYYTDTNPKTRKEIRKERDLRFYSFRTDLAEWRSIVNVLLNEVGAKMIGIDASGYRVENYVNLNESGFWSNGLSFYVEGSSTVSEAATNEVGESILAGFGTGIADKARELAFITGTSDRSANLINQKGIEVRGETKGGVTQNVLGGLQDMATKAVGLVTKGGSTLVSGENLLFPKVWKSSSFEKSYNLAFKFISPYGDPHSIFEYVYVPFLALFAMAFPRQVKPDSYKAPMLIRMDSPSFMNCDMGMITSFTYIRGGSENLWTPEGYPMAIDVTLTVTDMYPTLCVASNMALLRQNMGLSAFLDNLAGLNVMKANIAEHIKGSLTSKLSFFAGAAQSIKQAQRNNLENIFQNFF